MFVSYGHIIIGGLLLIYASYNKIKYKYSRTHRYMHMVEVLKGINMKWFKVLRCYIPTYNHPCSFIGRSHKFILFFGGITTLMLLRSMRVWCYNIIWFVVVDVFVGACQWTVIKYTSSFLHSKASAHRKGIKRIEVQSLLLSNFG